MNTSNMKVPALKAELASLGLATSGLKSVLKERLAKALERLAKARALGVDAEAEQSDENVATSAAGATDPILAAAGAATIAAEEEGDDFSDGGDSILTTESEGEGEEDVDDVPDPGLTKKRKKFMRRKERTDEARALNAGPWQGGLPRSKVTVLKSALPKEGQRFESRDECELYAAEIFESTGSLTTVTKNGGVKTATNLSVACASDAPDETEHAAGGDAAAAAAAAEQAVAGDNPAAGGGGGAAAEQAVAGDSPAAAGAAGAGAAAAEQEVAGDNPAAAGVACQGIMSFVFSSGPCPWLLTKMTKCTCKEPAKQSSANGSTAIPSAALQDIVQPLIQADFKVTGKVLKAVLQPYLFLEPNQSLLQRLRNSSKVTLYGEPLAALQALPALVASLNEMGHRAVINYLNADEMCARVLEIEHSKHNYEQKKKAREDRTRWNKGEAEARVAAEYESKDALLYVDSVLVTFSHAPLMLPHVFPATASDFAAGKDKLVGLNFGARTFLTANSNILGHTFEFLIGNEDEPAWDKLDKQFLEHSPEFDAPGSIDFSDADKGAAASFEKNFVLGAHYVKDLLHRKVTISGTAADKGGGTAAKDLYARAFFAPTPAKLEAVKQEMPPKTARLLGKTPDKNQYPMVSGGSYGINGSSTAESLNKALLFERGLHLAAAFSEAVKSEHGRFNRAKGLAMSCTTPLPPRVAEQQNVVAISASRITGVKFEDTARDVALVPLLGDPSRTAKVILSEVKNINAKACDAGCMVVSGLPCAHVHSAANAKGVSVVGLMDPRSTTAGWQRQFRDVEFRMPSAADISRHSSLINKAIRLPLSLKRPKGRPKKDKRMPGRMDFQSGKNGNKNPPAPPWEGGGQMV